MSMSWNCPIGRCNAVRKEHGWSRAARGHDFYRGYVRSVRPFGVSALSNAARKRSGRRGCIAGRIYPGHEGFFRISRRMLAHDLVVPDQYKSLSQFDSLGQTKNQGRGKKEASDVADRAGHHNELGRYRFDAQITRLGGQKHPRNRCISYTGWNEPAGSGQSDQSQCSDGQKTIEIFFTQGQMRIIGKHYRGF